MSAVVTRDGTTIFYRDWGSGRPVVFGHGWPLNANAWDPQLLLMASNGSGAGAMGAQVAWQMALHGEDADTFARQHIRTDVHRRAHA
jgi:non-heme chloroperoxidase